MIPRFHQWHVTIKANATCEYRVGVEQVARKLVPTGAKEGQVSKVGSLVTGYAEQASESLGSPFQAAAERCSGQGWLNLVLSVCSHNAD